MPEYMKAIKEDVEIRGGEDDHDQQAQRLEDILVELAAMESEDE